MVDKDVAALKTIIADDWVGQSDSGKIATKAGIIKDLTSGATVVTSETNGPLTIRVRGNTAIVHLDRISMPNARATGWPSRLRTPR